MLKSVVLLTLSAVTATAAVASESYRGSNSFLTGIGKGQVFYDPVAGTLTSTGTFSGTSTFSTLNAKGGRVTTSQPRQGLYVMTMQLNVPLRIDTWRSVQEWTRTYREIVYARLSGSVQGFNLSIQDAAQPTFKLMQISTPDAPMTFWDADGYQIFEDPFHPRSKSPWSYGEGYWKRYSANNFAPTAGMLSSDLPKFAFPPKGEGQYRFHMGIDIMPSIFQANGESPMNGPITKPFAFNTTFSFTREVPEPATWAMMIVGFGCVGAALRRRSVATAHSTPAMA